MIHYVYTGEPMAGSADDEYFIGFKGSTGTDNNTINGNGGDDLVIADSSDTWIPNASYTNGSIATAFNLENLTSTWTTAENQMFGDWTIPHTTIIAEATIGQSEFFRVAVGAGQQITVDIDFASNTPVGTPRDLVVELQDGFGNIIATADDSLVTDGGHGSAPSSQGSSSSYDPYLVYTVATAGIYYLNVRPFGGGPGSTFTENNTFLLNLSVTGHAANTTNPIQGADTVDGGNGDDRIFGQGGADSISGGAGNDLIDGGSGFDYINGGAGRDTLYGGEGSEEDVHGGEGNDALHSGGEGHYYGDGGNDTVYAGLTSGVNEVLDGGAGTDTLDTRTWNGAYEVNLVSGATNFGESFTNFENVSTGNGTDTITGTGGRNAIRTNGGIDSVAGGGGDDTVAGGADGDNLDGGADFDTLDYSASSGAVTVSLDLNSAAGGHAAGDVITGFEAVWGSVLGDDLTGGATGNELRGREGNDTLTGLGGNDTLDGGLNDDVMAGGPGNDVYVNPILSDTIVETANGGNDLVESASSYALGPNLERLRLTGTLATNGTGNGLANMIIGNDAANTLAGSGGNDTLQGNAGDDRLSGGPGTDLLKGGDGNDTYINPVLAGRAADTITETARGGTDTVKSAASVSIANTANVENVTLTGSAAANASGNGLANVLIGNGANNVLSGGSGADTLNGAGGSDTLIGGSGNDTMNGGAGTDVFRFTAAAGSTGTDRIHGWEGIDRFDLSGGQFTSFSEANGNTMLFHAGGRILIVGVDGLSLTQWNARVLPDAGPLAVSEPPLLHHAAFDVSILTLALANLHPPSPDFPWV